MNREQLTGAKSCTFETRDLKLKAGGLIREADQQAEELERQQAKSMPRSKREDANQAAFRAMRESTER
jgi:hypothetical protein